LKTCIEVGMFRIMQGLLTLRRNRIIKAHLPPQARRIGDFGCGHFPNRFATDLVDSISSEDLQRGGLPIHSRAPGLTFHDLDLNSFPYPFEDGHFDYLICSHVLEHLEDPVRACKEFSRIAKAGYIEVPYGSVDIYIRNNDAIHNWLCALDSRTDTLIFARRQEMLDLLPPPWINQALRFILQLKNLALVWEGAVRSRYALPPS